MGGKVDKRRYDKNQDGGWISTKGSENVSKIINICAHIFINNNFQFITGKDRLSLPKKTSIIIIIIIIMKTKDGFMSYQTLSLFIRKDVNY